MMDLVLDDRHVELPDAVDERLGSTLWQRFNRLADWLPEGVDRPQFLITSAAAANAWFVAARPKVTQSCPIDYPSVSKSVFNAAVVGLPLVEQLGYAYLVPMKVDQGKPSERVECQLWYGYKGFIELARSNNVVETITPEIVYKDETFERWNDENGAHFRHEPNLDRPDKIDMKDIRGAYVMTKSSNGFTDFEYVGGSTLRQLAKRGNVWRSNPVEMAKKTPVRRISKRWPQTTRLGYAVRLDEQSEAGECQTELVPTATVPMAQLNATEPVPEWVQDMNAELQNATEDTIGDIHDKYRKDPRSDDNKADELVRAFMKILGTDEGSPDKWRKFEKDLQACETISELETLSKERQNEICTDESEFNRLHAMVDARITEFK